MTTTCPATSPETGRPCALPDQPDPHRAGHESALVGISRVSWATTEYDRLRWAVSPEFRRSLEEFIAANDETLRRLAG